MGGRRSQSSAHIDARYTQSELRGTVEIKGDVIGPAVLAEHIRATDLMEGSDMTEKLSDQERAMVAAAMLAARYLDAALRSGMGKEEIDGVLAQVTRDSGVSEIWITDEHGRIVFGSGDLEFTFPADPAAASQAAPFAALLLGTESVVVQEPRPRDVDAAVFQYVGVAGVDRPRIVQVGMARQE